MGDVAKTIGQVVTGIGGAVLGTMLAPGIGTAVGGGLGGGLLGGAAAGGIAAGANALGSEIFRGKAPGVLDTLVSFGAGAVPGGFAGYKSVPTAAGMDMAGANTEDILSAKLTPPGNLSFSSASSPSFSGVPSIGSEINPSAEYALSSMGAQSPTYGQIALQAGLIGGLPALATGIGAALNRPEGPREPPSYEGGASPIDNLRRRREERKRRAEMLGGFYG